MKVLQSLAIIGFIACTAGQIKSLFLPSEAMPPWGFAILSGILPLGIAAIFVYERTGMFRGIGGGGTQGDRVNSQFPKGTIKMVMGLLAYNLFLFTVTVARQIVTHSTAKGVSPLFATCTGAMIFYFLLAMIFHLAESSSERRM